eukprot:SAG11_NODE_13614_length_647_cov_1.122263_1_plen_76_part_00
MLVTRGWLVVDGGSYVIKTLLVQLLAAVDPSLVAQLVVDWERAIRVHVPREHRGCKLAWHGHGFVMFELVKCVDT